MSSETRPQPAGDKSLSRIAVIEARCWGLEHVPFNASASDVVVVPGTDLLRALPVSTMRMQLIAVEHGSDRLIGEYTFHHTPWAQLQQK